MEAWTVAFLDEALPEFERLPADIRARFQRIIAMVREEGLSALVMPYARPVKGRLWEMRAKGKDGIARGLYVAVTGRRVMLVRFFEKKVQKTPQDEIRIALKRCGEHRI
jgi:phage-related protein